MKAYKCDICGCFFENESKKATIKRQEISLVRYSNGDIVREFDICPDCISALQKAIDERNINKEKYR